MTRYIYDPHDLQYKQVESDLKSRILRIVKWVAASILVGLVIILAYSLLFDTPRERELRQENKALSEDYKFLLQKYSRIDTVLEELQAIDQDIYRTIFETEPVDEDEEEKTSPYSFLAIMRMNNEVLVDRTKRQLDVIVKEVELVEDEYLYLKQNAGNKKTLLLSLPAIQPISNPDLSRIASGYGNRMHPIYKIEKFHKGIDLTAPTGTEVYATGRGSVSSLNRSRRGNGNTIIIDHGNGYETVYSHLDAFNVRRGQSVKRGEKIGTVGSTGFSTAPHLHYEVRLNGEAVNPVNYFFLELSPEEYEKVIEMSIKSGQSFD